MDTEDVEGPVDYSDFQYQFVKHLHAENGGNSASSLVKNGVDPLESSGGLDVNEVAELVYMQVVARVAEDGFEPTGDTRQGNIDVRGTVGVNLAPARSSLINTVGTPKEGTVVTEADGADVTKVELQSVEDPAWLDSFDIDAVASFADATNGLGGGGSYQYYQREISYRNMTGRGPVLDSEDEISILTQAIKNQVDTNVEAEVELHLIWDVSTVDDAGQRFSVPQ